MQPRQPWRPRMSDERLFNPFMRSVDAHPEPDEPRLDEVEEPALGVLASAPGDEEVTAAQSAKNS